MSAPSGSQPPGATNHRWLCVVDQFSIQREPAGQLLQRQLELFGDAQPDQSGPLLTGPSRVPDAVTRNGNGFPTMVHPPNGSRRWPFNVAAIAVAVAAVAVVTVAAST